MKKEEEIVMLIHLAFQRQSKNSRTNNKNNSLILIGNDKSYILLTS